MKGIPPEEAVAPAAQKLTRKHKAETAKTQGPGLAELPVPFVKVEKNLSSLGFFTASNVRLRGATKKVVTFTREMDGRRVEARAVILPSAEYGLPITADQDKFLALQKLINEVRIRDGQVINPVAFTSSELLRVLGNVDSGNNYQDIYDWIMRMVATTISSQGVVYLAGRRKWATDIFHVFEKAVLFGMEMPDGAVADRNYIWLSEWQLENLNSNYLLPIDLETYKQLRNHIAKALVPLLQIWLYASRSEGQFEKRYTELCEILNVKRWRYLSKIRQILSPSLDELTKHGYLSNWAIEATSDKQDFKIIFWHGEKFHRDQRSRLAIKALTPVKVTPRKGDSPLLEQLVRRGIAEEPARQLLVSVPPNQPVQEQLEWGDTVVSQAPRGKFHNPPGFYVHLIRENVQPPEYFLEARKVRERRQEQPVDELTVELAYEEYRNRQVDLRIKSLTSAEFRRIVDERKKQIRKENPSYALMPAQTVAEIAQGAVRSEIAKGLNLLSYEEFRQLRQDSVLETRQESLFE